MRAARRNNPVFHVLELANHGVRGAVGMSWPLLNRSAASASTNVSVRMDEQLATQPWTGATVVLAQANRMMGVCARYILVLCRSRRTLPLHSLLTSLRVAFSNTSLR